MLFRSRFDVGRGRPALASYLCRVKEELSPHYEEAHKMLKKMSGG